MRLRRVALVRLRRVALMGFRWVALIMLLMRLFVVRFFAAAMFAGLCVDTDVVFPFGVHLAIVAVAKRSIVEGGRGR